MRHRLRTLALVVLIAGLAPACDFSDDGALVPPTDQDGGNDPGDDPGDGDGEPPDATPATPDATPSPADAGPGLPDAAPAERSCGGPEDCGDGLACCGSLGPGAETMCAPADSCTVMLCNEDLDCPGAGQICCEFPFGESLCSSFCPGG